MIAKLLRPKYFFFGIIVGFACCVVAGHVVSKIARFKHFRRLFFQISPAGMYYPTTHELLETAKHHFKPNQILVVIGGSSIMKGAGQNPDELWSEELQKLLGQQYKVINLGIDSGYFTAFGAVIYRVLREQFGKVIFVSTCASYSVATIDGGDGDAVGTYSYLFWDAYYKNLIHPTEEELKIIRTKQKKQILTAAGFEQHVLAYLDSFFYFRNLWNWMEYHAVPNVWSDFRANTPFQAIGKYQEQNVPGLEKMITTTLNDTKLTASQANSLMDGFKISRFFENNAAIYKSYKTLGLENLENAFLPQYRANILCVMTRYNSNLIHAFPRESQLGYQLLAKLSYDLIKKSKYRVIEAGPNFSPNDYADNAHFAASGGRKLAKMVANQVHIMARENKFISHDST